MYCIIHLDKRITVMMIFNYDPVLGLVYFFIDEGVILDLDAIPVNRKIDKLRGEFDLEI